MCPLRGGISICAVVAYCHLRTSRMARFLFHLQDHNMTNGDFAIFIFAPSYDDKPWNRYESYVDNADDLARRRRAFYAVKQVLISIRHSKTELSNMSNMPSIYNNRLTDGHVFRWTDGWINELISKWINLCITRICHHSKYYVVTDDISYIILLVISLVY